jgi:hypothetical protein
LSFPWRGGLDRKQVYWLSAAEWPRVEPLLANGRAPGAGLMIGAPIDRNGAYSVRITLTGISLFTAMLSKPHGPYCAHRRAARRGAEV